MCYYKRWRVIQAVYILLHGALMELSLLLVLRIIVYGYGLVLIGLAMLCWRATGAGFGVCHGALSLSVVCEGYLPQQAMT